MSLIQYKCSECDQDYVIDRQETKVQKSAIPSPEPSILKRNFQDHGDHTVFLHVEGNEVKNYRIIPQLLSIFDTLLRDNVYANRIINTLLETKEQDFRSMVLYITDSTTYHRFFREISKNFIQPENNVNIQFTPGMMMIAQSKVVFLLTDLETGLNVIKKGHRALDELKQMKPFKLQSLVIDTTMKDEEDLMKDLVNNKIKLHDDVKTILAFDTSKKKSPPLEIREYFLDRFPSMTIQVLNYHDTNGLKSIFLQSYFNLLDDPIEGREAFEILMKDY